MAQKDTTNKGKRIEEVEELPEDYYCLECGKLITIENIDEESGLCTDCLYKDVDE